MIEEEDNVGSEDKEPEEEEGISNLLDQDMLRRLNHQIKSKIHSLKMTNNPYHSKCKSKAKMFIQGNLNQIWINRGKVGRGNNSTKVGLKNLHSKVQIINSNKDNHNRVHKYKNNNYKSHNNNNRILKALVNHNPKQCPNHPIITRYCLHYKRTFRQQ